MNRWLCAAALLASLINLQGCGGPKGGIPTECTMQAMTECQEKQLPDDSSESDQEMDPTDKDAMNAAMKEQCVMLEMTMMCFNNCCDKEISMGTDGDGERRMTNADGNATGNATMTMTGKDMQEMTYASIEAMNAMVGMLGIDPCEPPKPVCMT